MLSDVRQTERDVAVLKASLREITGPLPRPVLVMLVGLPGSGKTFLSRRLVERQPMVVLESDALRRALFDHPTYEQEESRRLFRAVHQLIYDLLSQGIPVILDATNVEEAHRQMVYRVADQARARVIVVEVRTPEATIRRRLSGRGSNEEEGSSDAGWDVYERMKRIAERVRRRHLVADTSRDITPIISRIVSEIRRAERGKPT